MEESCRNLQQKYLIGFKMDPPEQLLNRYDSIEKVFINTNFILTVSRTTLQQ